MRDPRDWYVIAGFFGVVLSVAALIALYVISNLRKSRREKANAENLRIIAESVSRKNQ
ncbi:MAG: hypothetical protein HY648_08180 [Acidobacteria bacterium]|nr:hypothetical protein [Acidobacteriota bacterium]